MKKTIVYIDGFNFYYGLFKGTVCKHLKWLDLWQLFHHMLGASHQLQEIKYFTADIKNDVEKSRRQQSYFRALKNTPNNGVNIIRGHYRLKRTRRHITTQSPDYHLTCDITFKTPEEKGTDVNLATHLLNDAWRGAFDCAVIASNDSDLAESLRLIKQQPQLNQELILVTPGEKIPRTPPHPPRTTSNELWLHADQKRIITKSRLQRAQFPDAIPGTTIHKPPEW